MVISDEGEGGPLRILYIEDDEDAVEATRVHLARKLPPVLLRAAGTMKEGKVALSTWQDYDLVITDMRLPDGDGLALLSHIRGRSLPLAVVLTTEAGDEDIAVTAIKAGADDYIAKRPGYLAGLHSRLLRAIAHRRAVAALISKPINVLYLEDSEGDASQVQHYLAKNAVHIHLEIITSAEDLLPRLALRERYQVLLLDYKIENRHSLDLLAGVFSTAPDIAVVLITALGDEDVAVEALRLGVIEYVAKRNGYLLKLPSVLESAYHSNSLQREHRRLLESEERYRGLFENAKDIVFMIDLEGRVIAVNRAGEAILGYVREEEEPVFLHQLVAPEHLERAGKSLALAASGKEVGMLEIDALTKDGRRVPLEVSLRAVVREGRPVGIQGIARDVSERQQAQAHLEEAIEKLDCALRQTVDAMALTVEMRDPYTAGHQRRMKELATAIAGKMALSEDQVSAIDVAGLLHDIGKIAVPHEILSRPGPISPAEMAIIHTHPQVGFDLLKGIDFPWPVARIILQHHERLDGTGYPDGISGDDMLIESRVLAVADVVEAMSSHRPYRPALSAQDAVQEISAGRGAIYDATVVDACLEVLAERAADPDFRLQP